MANANANANGEKTCAPHSDLHLQSVPHRQPSGSKPVAGKFRFLSQLLDKHPITIAHISHNRHNRRWCTFFKPAYFFSCPADSSIGDLVTDSLTHSLSE